MIRLHPGAVLEILLSSFQATCLSRMHAVGSSCRVFSDATTQIFAKVSNFPSWWPKKKKRSKGRLTLLFGQLCMPRKTLWPKRGAPIIEGKSWVISGNLRNPSKTTPVYIQSKVVFFMFVRCSLHVKGGLGQPRLVSCSVEWSYVYIQPNPTSQTKNGRISSWFFVWAAILDKIFEWPYLS